VDSQHGVSEEGLGRGDSGTGDVSVVYVGHHVPTDKTNAGDPVETDVGQTIFRDKASTVTGDVGRSFKAAGHGRR
jgi:hypothetical protein